MGFCLHNNAAVSALAAQAAGAKKVLIVDWVRSMFFSQVVGPITGFNSFSHNFFFLSLSIHSNSIYFRMFIMEMEHRKYLSKINRYALYE